MTLKNWFSKNTKRPLAGIIFLVALFWFFSVLLGVVFQDRERKVNIDYLGNAISLALSQKNRVALESLLNSATTVLHAERMALCRGNEYILGFNSDFKACENRELKTIYRIVGTENVLVKASYEGFYKNKFIWLSCLFGLFFVLLIVMLLQIMYKKLIKEIFNPMHEGFLSDTTLPIKELEAIRVNMNEFREVAKVKAVNDAIVLHTKQVSHDIRSPLSALNMIYAQLKDIPESHRIIIRNSVQRINDIANQLLEKGKRIQLQDNIQSTSGVMEAPLILKPELLSPLIEALVSEKRVQFREKQGVEIEADINQGYGLFANIDALEFKRTISNLLNNSIEAFKDGKVRVVVSIRRYKDLVSIVVQDNGKGIPEYILFKLGEEGMTHGKEGTQSGSGLGIYHAKKTIESFGGTFVVESKVGTGTSITMSFPIVPVPKWFVDKIDLSAKMQVVSLDDDLSIHGIWKGRIQSLSGEESGVECLTFTSGVEFKEWVKTKERSGTVQTKRLYLVDFELLNQKETGLEIIEELGIGAQAILVTSRYEETHIREKCEKLSVRLIPKGMAPWVPMQIEKDRIFCDLILIDDDEIMHATWKMMAQEKNKKLVCFFNADDFFRGDIEFDFNSMLFVDSKIGDGIKGEEISKKAFEMGFKNIYLCTGCDPGEFPSMPWLKSVVGKDYPDF